MAEVSFSKVRKTYDGAMALAGLDLDIPEGAFMALLGPSGSGKTTTLNLLAGLLDPDEGEIRIGGRVVNDITPDRRDIAMVFQNYALYPHLTIFENLEFPLRARNRRIAAAVVQGKVRRVADALGLGELLHRYPKELSGGQQQRVALGRAMIRDPKVFLLDEPLSNLDARLRIRMRRDIRALHASIGSTIVYVTHDQAEAMTLATQVAVFNEGVLQQVADPATLYQRPANRFVAEFLGEREPSFLAVPVTRDGGTLHLGPVGSVLVSEAPHLAHLAGREAVLCLRPEAVAALRDLGAGVPATVVQVELSGIDAFIYARLATGAELLVRAEASARFAPGETIALRLHASRLLAFDPASGAAQARWD